MTPFERTTIKIGVLTLIVMGLGIAANWAGYFKPTSASPQTSTASPTSRQGIVAGRDVKDSGNKSGNGNGNSDSTVNTGDGSGNTYSTVNTAPHSGNTHTTANSGPHSGSHNFNKEDTNFVGTTIINQGGKDSPQVIGRGNDVTINH